MRTIDRTISSPPPTGIRPSRTGRLIRSPRPPSASPANSTPEDPRPGAPESVLYLKTEAYAHLNQPRRSRNDAAHAVGDVERVGEVLHREEDGEMNLVPRVARGRVPDCVAGKETALAVSGRVDGIQVVSELLAHQDHLEEEVESGGVRVPEAGVEQVLGGVGEAIAFDTHRRRAGNVAEPLALELRRREKRVGDAREEVERGGERLVEVESRAQLESLLQGLPGVRKGRALAAGDARGHDLVLVVHAEPGGIDPKPRRRLASNSELVVPGELRVELHDTAGGVTDDVLGSRRSPAAVHAAEDAPSRADPVRGPDSRDPLDEIGSPIYPCAPVRQPIRSLVAHSLDPHPGSNRPVAEERAVLDEERVGVVLPLVVLDRDPVA